MCFAPLPFTAGFGPSGPGCFERADPQSLTLSPISQSETLSSYFLLWFLLSFSTSCPLLFNHLQTPGLKRQKMLGSPPVAFPSLQVLGSTVLTALIALWYLPNVFFIAFTFSSVLGIPLGQLRTNPSQPEAEIFKYHTLESKNKTVKVKGND